MGSCVGPCSPGRSLDLQFPLRSTPSLPYQGGFSAPSNKQELEQEAIVGKTLCNNERSTVKPGSQVRESSCWLYQVLEKETENKAQGHKRREHTCRWRPGDRGSGPKTDLPSWEKALLLPSFKALREESQRRAHILLKEGSREGRSDGSLLAPS